MSEPQPQLAYVEGDLFEQIPKQTGNGLVLIAHVCNNKGAWGKGFVIPLAQAMPDARAAYLEWHRTGCPVEHPSPSLNCEIHHSDNFGLGEIQVVETMPQRVVHEQTWPSVRVVNMVAQTLGGRRPLYYDHLAEGMSKMRQFIDERTKQPTKILCPMFGAGLAGGNWSFIEELIIDCWMRDGGFDVDVCYLPQFLPEGFEPPTVRQPAL